eukprot:243508-Pyramimonas_sp.AAC.1
MSRSRSSTIPPIRTCLCRSSSGFSPQSELATVGVLVDSYCSVSCGATFGPTPGCLGAWVPDSFIAL